MVSDHLALSRQNAGLGVSKIQGQAPETAHCIALWAMQTPAVEPLLADPEAVRKMLRSYVIKRLGEPSDASAMAPFLASDVASWITGQTYPVNGGYAFAQ